MTLAEIQERYKGQWVLIEFHQLDEHLEIVEGDVLATAATKEEIYKLLLTVERGKNTAIEYCGEWPADVAVMFWKSDGSRKGEDHASLRVNLESKTSSRWTTSAWSADHSLSFRLV